MKKSYHLTGLKIRFLFLGASRAPSLSNLGALIRIYGPWCRNVTFHFIVYVLAPEISRGLSGS